MLIDVASFDDGLLLANNKLGLKRKTEFLSKLDRIVPRREIEKIIFPYFKPSGRKGQQPYPLSLMLRVHVLQLVYNLSDPMTEETLNDSVASRRFVGLTIDSSTPDETTILRFRHLLEAHQLTDKVFALINQQLQSRGLLLSRGTIVVGSFIEAPSSTKNKAKARDPEMRSGKKGNTWHFGMKLHIGVDKISGLVHTRTKMPANIHDIIETDKLRRAKETVRTRKTAAKPYGQRKKLSPGGQKQEQSLTSVRSKVEHVFYRLKVQFGYLKTRYRGLYKNSCRLTMLLCRANLLTAAAFEARMRFDAG